MMHTFVPVGFKVMGGEEGMGQYFFAACGCGWTYTESDVEDSARILKSKQECLEKWSEHHIDIYGE